MKWRRPILLFVGLGWAGWGFLYRPFPLLGENGVLDLVAFHNPMVLRRDGPPSGPFSRTAAAHRSVRRRYPSATAGTPRCL